MRAIRCFLLLALTSTASTAADKPNILLIFADDWGWGDLSCHGHPYVKTPNIDRLACEGTDFTRFTVASGKQLTAKLEAWKATLPEKPTGAVFSAERR